MLSSDLQARAAHWLRLRSRPTFDVVSSEDVPLTGYVSPVQVVLVHMRIQDSG